MYTTFSAFVLSAAALLFTANTASAGSSEQAGAHAKPAPSQGGFTRIAKKKGGSGVDIAYQLARTPEVGKPLVVKIQIASSADAQVTVRAGDGLQLQSNSLVMQSAGGAITEQEMSVIPLTGGRHYVHLLSAAGGRTSASAIAVQVGKQMQVAKPAGEVKTMPNGERVISMPAQ
jgi:hypothetical protein